MYVHAHQIQSSHILACRGHLDTAKRHSVLQLVSTAKGEVQEGLVCCTEGQFYVTSRLHCALDTMRAVHVERHSGLPYKQT